MRLRPYWLTFMALFILSAATFIVVVIMSIIGITNEDGKQFYDRKYYGPYLNFQIVNLGLALWTFVSLLMMWNHFTQPVIDKFDDFNAARDVDWLDIVTMFRAIASFEALSFFVVLYMFIAAVQNYAIPDAGRAFVELPFATKPGTDQVKRGEEYTDGAE